jgi:hypothetical protein
MSCSHSLSELRCKLLAMKPLFVLTVMLLWIPSLAQDTCTDAAEQGKNDIVSAHKLEPAWSKSYPDLYPPPPQLQQVSLAISENARCAAIAGDGEVEVLDAAGQSLWKWTYHKLNRFIVAGPLAVSPNCDAIALAGDSGYKKVWLADQRGRAIPLTISSTPLGVAFDRHGELLAVGTGGSSILLFNKAGKQLWKRTFEPRCCLPDLMSFSDDNRYILIRDGGSGLLRTDGSVVWTGMSNGMNASRDLHTFVTWDEPNHGARRWIRNEAGRIREGSLEYVLARSRRGGHASG